MENGWECGVSTSQPLGVLLWTFCSPLLTWPFFRPDLNHRVGGKHIDNDDNIVVVVVLPHRHANSDGSDEHVALFSALINLCSA